MPQALEEGKCSYQGRSWVRLGFLKTKKSADAILATGNELQTEIVDGLTA